MRYSLPCCLHTRNHTVVTGSPEVKYEPGEAYFAFSGHHSFNLWKNKNSITGNDFNLNVFYLMFSGFNICRQLSCLLWWCKSQIRMPCFRASGVFFLGGVSTASSSAISSMYLRYTHTHAKTVYSSQNPQLFMGNFNFTSPFLFVDNRVPPPVKLTS